MASEYRHPEELRIVLFGGSGSGKSATGNTILGKSAFTTRQSQDTETLSCQRERGEFEGTPVSVVDTPWTVRHNTSDMSKCISYCAPGPHVFLAVIPLQAVTDVDRHLKILQCLFGVEASRYTVFLFTHGDELPDWVTAEQFIRQNPVPHCVGYHVFNNRDEDPSQVRELLEKIKRMVQRNGGSYCIKVKDWKDKYLYPFATAVTIGVGVGAASGGTGGGVLVAFLGSAVGAFAAHGDNRAVVTGAIAVAAVVGLAVAIGAGVVTGVGFVLKATAAITTGASFETFAHMVDICGLFGIFGGATVGAGVSVSVGAYAAWARLDLICAVIAVFCGGLLVVAALMLIVIPPDTSCSKIVGFAAVVGDSAGAAFGAAVGILVASDFAAGVMIYLACQAVIWWLNNK